MTGLPSVLVAITFLASGCAALVYQLVWQRYLFTGLGVDIDSVTLIVSTFMLGIGLGGAIGGWLADRFANHRLMMYAFAELTLAMFGAISPWVFAGIQALSGLGWHYGGVALLAVAVVLVPTTVMGTTLPMLTMYFDETLANVGVSVGLLYFFNTMGAAVGAWVTAHVLFVDWGLNGSAWLAAVINLCCFALTMVAARISMTRTTDVQHGAKVAS